MSKNRALIENKQMDNGEQRQGIFFRLSKADTEIFLLGTVHIFTDQIEPVFDKVTPYLTKSEFYLMEAVPSYQNYVKSQKLMFSEEDLDWPSKLLSTEEIKSLEKSLLLREIAEEKIAKIRDWAALVMLFYPSNAGIPFDIKLFQFAEQHSIESASLERIEDQFSIFMKLDKDKLISSLKRSLEMQPKMNEEVSRLVDLYLKGKLDELLKSTVESVFFSPELTNYFMEHLLKRRNQRMLESIEMQLPGKKKIFVAVGAAHLAGEDGLLELLKAKGYEIEKLF